MKNPFRSDPGIEVIYLSGPMSDKRGFRASFGQAEKKLREAYPWAVILNPAKISDAMPGLPYSVYLEVDLALVRAADAIMPLTGWEKSPGAQAEMALARSLKKRIMKGLGDVF